MVIKFIYILSWRQTRDALFRAPRLTHFCACLTVGTVFDADLSGVLALGKLHGLFIPDAVVALVASKRVVSIHAPVKGAT